MKELDVMRATKAGLDRGPQLHRRGGEWQVGEDDRTCREGELASDGIRMRDGPELNTEHMTEHPNNRKGQDNRDDGKNVSAHGPFWHGAGPRRQ